ncbi:MAG TPA: PKD-like domain-containing protein [Mucilaginibacter sp.]|nr:PKD-like domain-containing protein [Mucilaginibacter sp.]
MKNSLLLFLFLLLTLGGYSQTCTLSVNITSSSPAICSGGSILLTATPSGGTAPFTYAWNTGETTQTIPVNKVGTYTVTVTDNTPGCQPVPKSFVVVLGTVPSSPTAAGKTVCRNSSATLTATAPGGTYQWFDAPTGGNFLVANATLVTPPITATTTFYVQTTLSGCTSLRTPVVVNIYPDPNVTRATVCSGSVATLTATRGDSYAWYNVPAGGSILSNASSFVTPPLLSSTAYYVSSINNGCVSPRVRVFAIVTPPLAPPTAPGTAVCAGVAANLHATAPAGVLEWFNVPSGGTALISSPDYTTPSLATTTTYYVQATLNECSSPRTPVTVTVNPIPAAPTITGPTICTGSSALLTPTGPGGTYQWFDAPAGGNLLFTGNTFGTPALNSSTTYYVQVSNGSCTSGRTPVTVNVTQPPAAPVASGPLICSGSSATLTATAPGGTYQWFSVPTGGAPLITNATYVTPALITATTYYVQTTVGTCVSPRTAVTVSILPQPTPPTAPSTSVCSGGTATLVASGGLNNYQWYDAATNGNLVSSSQVFITPPLASTTTYYVQTISNGCESTRSAVTVTVNPTPTPPTVSGTTNICPGTSTSLTATAVPGTIQWYDAATGGNLLFTGNPYNTPLLNATTTYYVEVTTATCTSTRRAVTITVINVADPQFQYASGTFCTSGANPAPVINNPAGGTFSALPAGLVFTSTTTGQINVGASAPGTYVVSFAGNGPCPRTTVASINISSAPDAQFSYSGPYCQDGTNPLPTFPVGSSAGVFTASPGGLIFVNASTGEINLKASNFGTYTITNTIAATGGCPASVKTSTVTINQVVTVSAGPNQTVPSGTPVQLAGNISGGIATGTWNGGAGSFSNPAILNPIYTPAAGETSVVLNLVSNDPPGPCGPQSDKVTITFGNVPAAPTAAGTSLCVGSSASLSATAPGGVYQWYDAPTGGTLLATNPNFSTPPLLTTTTYYVQTTVGGVASARTPVTVTVFAVPAMPVVSSPPICKGSTTSLTATGTATSYEWFDAPVGGNLLSINTTFVTPALTTNTTYYVQATALSCSSARTQVDVVVNPIPKIISAPSGSVCSGTALNYAITSDVPAAVFSWDRAAVPNISNPAVTGQTSATIGETLINTGSAPVTVTYIITPSFNGCTGAPFNYAVTVNPVPIVTSGPTATICSGATDNYAITFSGPVSSFTWSRAAVPGISNTAVSGQAAGTIREVLFNTTDNPIDVTYVITYKTNNCSNLTYNFVETVNPAVNITSSPIGTACSFIPQTYIITSNIPTATFTWSRAAVPNIQNPAVSGQTSNIIDEALVNNGLTNAVVSYIIVPTANGCPGTPFTYAVAVNPKIPTPVANSNTPVCINSTIQLRTPTVPKATYSWTGPNGFTSNSQNPNVPNVTAANAGTYSLIVTINGCPSAAATVDVAVHDKPIVDAGIDQKACTNATSVQLAGNVTGGTSTGSWTTNGTGTFKPASNQLNAQYFPSAHDKAVGTVVLTLTSSSTDDCTLRFDNMTITFSAPAVTSGPTGGICTGVAQNYIITSDVPTATFTWSRAAVPGISNPAVSGQISSTITETLFNTTAASIDGVYIITPNDNGCPGLPYTYTVTVYPSPQTPTITSNTPVCVNTPIRLQTPAVANATYLWTGPNGFTSPNQNPVIPGVSTAAAGTYSLVETVSGCPSQAATIVITVDELPHADAGTGPLVVCPTATGVPLAGSVTGGTTTGTWSTSGSGTFSPNTPAGNYHPSAQDIAAGSVVLTLASTSNDNCAISTSSITVKFELLPGADAGTDQEVCAQGSAKLAGKIFAPGGGGVWTSSGTGSFSPSASQLDAVYNPSAADVKNGTVTLTLTANSPGTCYTPTDQMTLKLTPPPTVNAGGNRFVLRGNTITLKPTVSDENVTYLWTPNTNISDNTVKNPVITGSIDITYTLTVTDSRGCVNSDKTFIKVSPAVTIPTAFTPNGDGINDTWNIYGLAAYEGAAVDVFDRYGQKVFHSIGYGVAWDGTISGKQLPFGAYYYVIDTKVNGLILSGVITIVR